MRRYKTREKKWKAVSAKTCGMIGSVSATYRLVGSTARIALVNTRDRSRGKKLGGVPLPEKVT